MTLTRHNHRIKGTTLEDEPKLVTSRARCGGPGMCLECTQDELDAFKPKPGPSYNGNVGRNR